MLVLFSDIHLTDESTSSNVHPSAFDILKKEILDASKKDARDIRVIMVGDIFDIVRTDYWNRNKIPKDKRPWNGTLDNKTATNNNFNDISDQYSHILNDILLTKSAQSFVNMLNTLRDESNLDTFVTYVIGNHDQALNNFPNLKTILSNNIRNLEFSHCYKNPDYGVLARHGHEWDEECYGLELYNKVLTNNGGLKRFEDDSYKVMSIGEVITAELMGGIIYYVNQGLIQNNFKSEEDKIFLKELKDVNNLRPMLATFRWLDWFTSNRDGKYTPIISEALKNSIDAVINSELGKKWDDLKKPLIRPIGGDITDWLDFARNHIVGTQGLETLRKLSSILYDTFFLKNTSTKDDLVDGAKKEWENHNISDAYQYVIYGHTHEARTDCFTGNVNGTVKMYINSGTYLPMIELTEDQNGFATSYQMTMIFVYADDENTADKKTEGPTIDIWNGLMRKTYI